MTCGIYKVENLINGKIYIGQSVNIENRKLEHLSHAGCDKTKFHRALSAYGKNNFKWSILEECDRDKLNEREIYWISAYDSFNNGYNMTSGGDGAERKIISQYDLQGNYIRDYGSITEASLNLNIPMSNISQAITKNGNHKSAGGFQWTYKGDPPPGKWQKIYKNNERHNKGGRPKGSSKQQSIIKTWQKDNPKGTKAQCIKETGISKTTVYRHWNKDIDK
jgi:hypothetical protein